MSTRVNQKNIKSLRKEYIMWTCFKLTDEKYFLKTVSQWEFDFGLFTNYFRLQRLLEFIQTQKEVSYLSKQNNYDILKTTCHLKLKFFLWTKLPENILLAKYLISVAATLILSYYHYQPNLLWQFLREWIQSQIAVSKQIWN